MYLITGGAGFIGSNLARALVNKADRVRILDNFSTGKESNLEDIKNDIEIVKGDIRDLDVCRKAVKNVDCVFHIAAIPSVQRSIKDPVLTHDVNALGTLNILIASRDKGIKRVIYSSSSSVYGNSEVLPLTEDMKPNPLSPYAVSKLTGEYYCKVFYEVYGIETVSLRYFNVFGPYQDPYSEYAAVIPKFIILILNGQSPVIYGDGNQSRDFTYIDNVVHANILAAEINEIKMEKFNIATGNSVSINNLSTEIMHILNIDIEPIYSEKRPGDIRKSLADISYAKNYFNYKPLIEFKNGLKNTIEWFSDRNRIY